MSVSAFNQYATITIDCAGSIGQVFYEEYNVPIKRLNSYIESAIELLFSKYRMENCETLHRIQSAWGPSEPRIIYTPSSYANVFMQRSEERQSKSPKLSTFVKVVIVCLAGIAIHETVHAVLQLRKRHSGEATMSGIAACLAVIAIVIILRRTVGI